MYGGNAVPGSYLKTRTGVTRGTELFSRPDTERPWRTVGAQKHASEVARKEHEIEQLMLLCCNLRTELGNVKNDARAVAYAMTEKNRSELTAKDDVIEKLNETISKLKAEAKEAKDRFEHQVRLIKSQHENDLATLRNEVQGATRQQLELVQTYQSQIEDVRSACAREMEYADTRRRGNVEELLSDSCRLRESLAAERQHYTTQIEEMKKTIARIEEDFAERLRISEQRVGEMHHIHTKELETERAAKEAALHAGRVSSETLAAVSAERSELVERYKQWNQYILRILNTHLDFLSSRCAHLTLPSMTESMKQTAALYSPRAILEDFESKAVAERVVHRLVLLHSCEFANPLPPSLAADEPSSGGAYVHGSSSSIAQLLNRQSRLTQGLHEVEEQLAHAHSAMQNCTFRLLFFTDNLEMSIRHVSQNSPSPPLCHPGRVAAEGEVIFVCCAVSDAALLWDEDADTMRRSLSLLYGVLRLKQGEYGGYECYSDDTCMLTAFADPVTACRFCMESQQWLLHVPWPSALLRCSMCREECDESGSAQHVLFRGLRVAMAIHTGETFAEPTAIPLPGGVYRTHYYGKAVSQVTSLSSRAHGGQVVVSYPTWKLCAHRQDEMGAVSVTELGTHPVAFLNTKTWTQDTETMKLVQVNAVPLQNRTFKPWTMTTASAATSQTIATYSVSGLRRALTTTAAAALERQREGMVEMSVLLRREYDMVRKELAILISRASRSKTNFHTLSMPQMIEQATSLFSLVEKFTLRAEELSDDLRAAEDTQMRMNLQMQSFFQYCHHYAKVREKDDIMQAQIEALKEQLRYLSKK